MAIDKAQISEVELFYKTIIHKVQTGLVLTNGEGLVIKYNLEALQLSKNNLTHKNGTPKYIFDLFGEEVNEINQQIKYLLTGAIDYFEKDSINILSAEEKWVRITGITVKVQLAKFSSLCIFTLKDITENKRKENLLQSIQSNLNKAIFRTRLNNGIIYANEEMIELFGYDHESELIGKSTNQFCESDEQRIDLIRQIEREGIVINELVNFKKKNGKVFQGILNCSKFIDEKGQVYLDGSIINISELNQNRVILQQKNAELKILNQKLDRFFYSVSHDLKSPLTTILGLCNLLELDRESPDSVSQYTEMIRISTAKLNNILEDTISLAKNSGFRICSQKIDAEGMVNQIVKKLRYNCDQAKLRFTVKSDSKYVFFSDKYRIRIVLNNVIKNALLFYNARKAYHQVDVNISHHFDKLAVTVSDTGIGISQKHLPHIFNMFYRGTQLSKGSGIGLYIVKEALDKINGKITITSEIGEGTVVNIEIPNDPKGKLIAMKTLLKS